VKKYWRSKVLDKEAVRLAHCEFFEILGKIDRNDIVRDLRLELLNCSCENLDRFNDDIYVIGEYLMKIGVGDLIFDNFNSEDFLLSDDGVYYLIGYVVSLGRDSFLRIAQDPLLVVELFSNLDDLQEASDLGESLLCSVNHALRIKNCQERIF
jgi:hypothetical protein